MAEWNAVDVTGTSLPTPRWVAAGVSGASAAAGGTWRAVEVSAEAAAAGTAVWRVTELDVQALAPGGPSYVWVVGRDGSLYPAQWWVETPSGGLV